MQLVMIGEFVTDGSLLVSDPCYKKVSRGNQKLKVKPGAYDAYIIRGADNLSTNRIDKMPISYRNAQLAIVAQNYSGRLEFKKVAKGIDVDSGRAGFFSFKNYYKNSQSPEILRGEEGYYKKHAIIEGYRKIQLYKEGLQGKGVVFERVLERCQGNRKKAFDSIKESLLFEKGMLSSKKKLNLPTEPMFSQEFYKIIADLSFTEDNAGVHPDYGVVSSAFYGDGMYELYVARDTSGQIVAANIEFMSLNDLL